MKKVTFTVQLDREMYNELHQNATEIGVKGTVYARKIFSEELKKKTILKRMT